MSQIPSASASLGSSVSSTDASPNGLHGAAENAVGANEWALRPWSSVDLISFDTETSGKYPLTADICELAAVKWRDGKIVDEFSTLIRPKKLMGSEVIGIHGITNEMVENAPRIIEKIGAFREFIEGAVVMAHHAPFDLGFVALEFERAGIALPDTPALCTSLLSRKIFPESGNHRLQTLVKFFGIDGGTAHRALDDAKACLEVGLRCLGRLGADVTLAPAFAAQGGMLTWHRFAMNEAGSPAIVRTLIKASLEEKIVELAYGAGSAPGKKRRVHPEGIVRSLDGDFLAAYDEQDQKSKRYLLERCLSAEIVN